MRPLPVAEGGLWQAFDALFGACVHQQRKHVRPNSQRNPRLMYLLSRERSAALTPYSYKWNRPKTTCPVTRRSQPVDLPGLAASPHVDYCAVSTGTPFTTGTFHPTWLWSSNLPAAVEKSTKVLTRLWQTWRKSIQTQTRVVADALSQRVTRGTRHTNLFQPRD